MYISRIVIRNFRNFSHFDVHLNPGVTCVLGENNTGKTNLIRALRLVLDSDLSSQYRRLIEHDIFSGIDIRNPEQVIISVEFSDFADKENECALVGCWQVTDDLARLSYRFRPSRMVQEEIEVGERNGDLSLDDYHWEMTGGGENDPTTVEWHQPLGTNIRMADLQQFLVVLLPALRDVEQSLRQSRISPLKRIFDASDISHDEKNQLIEIIKNANDQVAESPTIQNAGNSIQASYSNTAGEAFDMGIRLGMTDPSFASISRSLTLLLSNNSLENFEIPRNGLGLNNIIYISMLLDYFELRASNAKTAGQILLIEEPESHIHPQLQRVLYSELSKKPFQTIITTHSTHISSQAPLECLLALTNINNSSCSSSLIAHDLELLDTEISDLERYLDATRSTLLFARKVILVEGPAELFLIPALVKKVMDIDLERRGITVIPIFGIHFPIYARLFANAGLPKKCAIIADGDLTPDNLPPADPDEDETPEPPNLSTLRNEYVNVFQCRTTFERAVTLPGTINMLAFAADECGASRSAEKLRRGLRTLNNGDVTNEVERNLLADLRSTVLNTAKRFGKARFAQKASKYVDLAEEIPAYIRDAINWLIADEPN